MEFTLYATRTKQWRFSPCMAKTYSKRRNATSSITFLNLNTTHKAQSRCYRSKFLDNTRYMGAAKLSDVLPGTNAIVTALKLEKTWQDNMAKVFSSKQAKVDQSENFLMRDVGRATSAAPTFFPAAEIKSFTGKTYQLVDGGVGKNNPSNLVLENLKKGLSNEERDNFFLLSLSTGVKI